MLWLCCDFDSAPMSFLKMVFDCVENDVLSIVNCSLSTGAFPDASETAPTEKE